MGFTEAFIECMQNAGVQGDLTGIAQDQATATAAVQNLKNVYEGLGEVDKNIVDSITTDLQGAQLLAEAGAAELVNVIDATVGWTIKDILQYCDYCLEQAAQAGESGETESEGA